MDSVCGRSEAGLETRGRAKIHQNPRRAELNRDGEYLIESVEHTLDMQGGFITRCHLIRNFCEVSNRSGTASEIDRERADSQINGSQEENAVAVSSLSSGSQSENQGDSENTSNEKNPKITNPHWENADGQAITKALVGDEVYLCADVTDIADGATATIKIVEKNDDGNDDFITDKKTSVQSGKIKYKWEVVYTDPRRFAILSILRVETPLSQHSCTT